MRSVWRIFWLEWTDLVRSRTVVLLLAASVAWMFLAPRILCGDGTPDGARTMVLRYSLGGVAALAAVALTAAATSSVARERAANRLQLTLVRPVSRFGLVLAKMAALSTVALIVLAVSAGIEAVRADAARPCRHVYGPVLPSLAEEAAGLYDSYMKDPETPPEARKLPKSAILHLLAQRARENYQPVATNAAAVWSFPAAAFSDRPSWLRLRVTNDWNLRDDARLVARLGSSVAFITNLTQAVSEFPLVPSGEARAGASAANAGTGSPVALELSNVGAHSIMLRPRRDIEVLVEADSFRANLVRATLELWAIATVLIAFGVFLGSVLTRPVALFTAFVTLTLSEMSPSVLESYSGDLTEGRADRIALSLTRFAEAATRPVSSLTPLEKLAGDACVEPREVAGAVLSDMIILPCLLALLAAAALRRKTSDAD